MDYIKKTEVGSTLAPLPSLGKAQIKMFPKDWTSTLAPMKRFRNDLMLKKGLSISDEYSNIMSRRAQIAEELTNPELPFLRKNALQLEDSKLADVTKDLYNFQFSKKIQKMNK